MASGPITTWQTEGEKVEVVTISSPWAPKSLRTMNKPRQCVEKQRHYSADKNPHSQRYGLPSGHIWLWELDHKEGRMPKNWCLQNVVLEKTPESPLDSKEIKPVNLKGNQPWILTGRTEAKVPVFWSSATNRRLFGKVPDAGKDWGHQFFGILPSLWSSSHNHMWPLGRP